MGRGGFGKGKYKKIIKSIYPLTPNGDIQVHNIGKLVHFCQISPTKLIKVARYVEKKTNSDLTKSRLRFIEASMKIFQDLIKGCRKNLNLFSNNVLRLIKLLLECSFPDLKMIATETFIQFTEVLDENTPYPELESLVSYLIDMCQNQIREPRLRTRLKQDGLRAIRSYIRVLEMTDELDGFIARHTDADNWAVFLPAILDNLSFVPVEASDHSASASSPHVPSSSADAGRDPAHALLEESDRENIHQLATEVLRDIFSRANISVTSMFKAILRYLEVKNRWIPNTFAVHCIQSIYDCLKVQHGQILITLLLQHAEQSHHPIGVKAQIFITTVYFFTESTGYFMQILDSLVKHLVSSVEFTAQDQLVDNNSHVRFQDDIITCLGLLCSKISQPQKMDAFNAVCTRLSQSKHVLSSGLSGVVVIFARAILQITHCMQAFPIDSLVPYLRLFQELSMHSNADVRIVVQKIFQSVLLPSAAQHDGNINFLKSHLSLDDVIPEQITTGIRGTLYFQIKMRMKQVENYVAIFDTLKFMLYRGGKYDLIESFPLVFSIQKFASKWKKIPPIRAYTIHTLVAAYLYCVALIFRCKALELHVDQIMQDRAQKGQQCTVVQLEKLPVPTMLIPAQTEYSHAPQKKVAVDYVLFDRQAVVDMLCSEGASTVYTEKRYPKALMKKYKHQNDTMTLKLGADTITLATAESTIIQASLSVSAPQENPISDVKSVVIFSPDNGTGAEELEKSRELAKIDIVSMKRALVLSTTKLGPSRSFRSAYNNVATDCHQKMVDDRNLYTAAMSAGDAGPSWCVLDANLELTT